MAELLLHALEASGLSKGEGRLLIQWNCASFGLVVSVAHITKRLCSVQENSVAPVGTTAKTS